MRNLINRLNSGTLEYNFVGRRRRWYLISGTVIAVAIIALLVRGLTLGIEFKGGADFQAPVQVTAQTRDDMATAVQNSNVPDLGDVIVTTIGDNTVRVQTRTLSVDEVPQVRAAIAQQAGVGGEQVAYSLIGASWGEQITKQGIIALVVFLILVMLVFWIYFRDPKMAVAGILALLHDLVVTIGVYALVGFTVTPATLIGVLTILGYSLYDTVVVFDKVRENVRDLAGNPRRTYSEAANAALNQVMVRSLSTTIIGVLPVAALLFAGVVVLGQGPLQDLSLALFVGLVAGAYSSIFLATVLLAQMKEREPEMIKLAERVQRRRNGGKSGRAQSTDSADPAVGAGETADPPTDPEDAQEPSDADLAAAGAQPTRQTRVGNARVSVESAARSAPSATEGAGASGRPQPRNTSRSQRKRRP